jgi:hypothetical protein
MNGLEGKTLMGYIPPISINPGGRHPELNPAAYQTAGLGQASGSAGDAGYAASPGATSAITQIHSAVSQLLQSVGGGVENDKMLRMLIALLILLALLDNSQPQTEGAQNALAQLGSRGNSQSQFLYAYQSSTTISMEYTTTTWVAGNLSSYGTGGGTEQLQPQGASVDIKT